ncbi:hypothetical protein THAOC_24710 [Thalassiosira oceanica]|uniref:Uncharacterized protein n=1 Tax=Thalassiosira oceanica TaxID=159749 RepID=K0RR49_THAOC|nr:hypothetical protein THAOC_24710 [Thalassiosira oceanica]|eukprot:EJK55550.1 hypothetical protein THAOC_24710 [Thalassiosira oceanica]
MGPWHHIPAGFEVCLVQAGSNPKISAQKLGAAVEVEEDVGSQVLFPLPLVDSESEPILTGPGNLVSFFVWGKRPNWTGWANTARPCAGHGRVSIVAKCAPEGVPSGHEEGEARQLKTNPFPTQSYPTRKRQVQPISSNKPRDGRVGEKFVTSNAAEES